VKQPDACASGFFSPAPLLDGLPALSKRCAHMRFEVKMQSVACFVVFLLKFFVLYLFRFDN
jgi:hypothetical protein